ncbi:MAG TPA: DUF4239 domain-containing protein [Candidatus Acidoferrum sp.]|nr:DUF4239 domain-containing protein [Candidatus Acidoferrum sp.]
MTGFWSILVAPVVALVVVGGGVCGHLLFHRYVKPSVLRPHNDVIGFTISVVAVIYAVVLAFIVVVVWEDFGRAEDSVRAEISAATSLYADSLVFQGRAHIHDDLTEYTASVACEEWPAMEAGREGESTAERIARLVRDVTLVQPRDERERVAYGDALSLVHQVLALRSERLLRNERGLQPVLWVALLLGAAITVGFTYLLGVENFRFQLVATALLSLLIGLMFALIIALNYPFRGAVHVSREPWDTFYHTLTGKSVSCEAPRPRQ